MSELKFSCPDCGQHIAAEPCWSGLEVACPTCSSRFIVPGQAGANTPLNPGAPASICRGSATVSPPATGIRTRPSRSTSMLAIASLAFCISGILIFPGLVCGHLARHRISRDPGLKGQAIALAGLIVGYTGLVLAAVLLVGPMLLLLGHHTPSPTSHPSQTPTISIETPRPKPSPAADSSAAPVLAEFLALNGSPGWEVIRVRVTNLAGKGVREITLQYTYRDAQGKSMRVTQMAKSIEPSLAVNATQELSGMAFPPKETKTVDVGVVEVSFDDGNKWRREN